MNTGIARDGAAKAVRFVDVGKSYDQVVAVSGVNIDIGVGQFVTLLGPSGCGKSTTLNMIAGLEIPTSGKIFIGERDVTNVKPADRDIAMVFQSYALYPHLTLFENIAFPLRARRRRLSNETVRARVADVARALNLSELLERYPREISGGQRQRVALGRAMVRTPAIYLLDEPLSNLDQQLRVLMRSELKDLHQRLGATMLYVTHDQSEAMTLSDQVVVMSAGRIEQVGTPEDLYQNPANLFVARFLGEPGMNILEGHVENGLLRAEGVNVPVPMAGQHRAENVMVGIRPEDMVVTTGPDAQFSGIVRTREFLGARTLIRVDVGQVLINAILSPGARAIPGERIELAASDLTKLRWFDPTTTQAVPSARSA
jgi:ABC-type sugar transport system ATPase subunit